MINDVHLLYSRTTSTSAQPMKKWFLNAEFPTQQTDSVEPLYDSTLIVPIHSVMPSLQFYNPSPLNSLSDYLHFNVLFNPSPTFESRLPCVCSSFTYTADWFPAG